MCVEEIIGISKWQWN